MKLPFRQAWRNEWGLIWTNSDATRTLTS